jgi:hypothetical protein
MADFFKSYGPVVCLGVPGIFYLGQAAFYGLQQGRIGMTIAFVCYAGANIGFIMDSKGV